MTRLRKAILVFAAVLASSFALAAPQRGEAISPADWRAGNIISDQVFYNANTMTAQNVQDFLNLKGGSCVAGERPCLKDYRADTPGTAVEAGLCAGIGPISSASSAQIIYQVARACGVNPQVLVVLVQKESGLVSGTRPTAKQYNAATGFGCPDFQACNSQYYGLFNQVYRAARQFKVYAQSPTRYGYQAGRQNSILFNPDRACGASDVFIENQATANLYIYTPYQPNAAAVANLGGTGDACSAYGNRNFWRLFNDWFGSSRSGSPAIAAIFISNVNASVRATSADQLPARGSNNVACDWNGDGKATVAIFDGGRWTISEGGAVVPVLTFGGPGDLPVCGDWDGNGIDEIGIFRSSTATFYLRNSLTSGVADRTVLLGDPADKPLVGDWDGNGADEIGVYRPSNAHFYLAAGLAQGASVQEVWFGDVGDQPIVGKWNGGARTSIGVRRAAMYYLAATPTSGATTSFQYGESGDVSVFGDWNGDGNDTIAVIRVLGTS